MRSLISLGYKCEIAFQLRMHSGINKSNFFDWFMMPQVDAVIRTIERDFDVFSPEHLIINTNKTGSRRVRDASLNLALPHAFPLRNHQVIDDYMSTYTDFIAKFRYLAQRFRQTMRDQPVTLVRRNITQAEAERLEEAIFRRFPGADARFLYIMEPGGVEFETAHGHSRHVPEAGNNGHSLCWAKVLADEQLIEKPYRVSITEIVGSRPTHNFSGPEGTLADMEDAIAHNGENAFFLYEAADIAMKEGQLAASLNYIETAMAKAPGNIDFRIRHLQVARANGNLSPDQYLEGLVALNVSGDDSELGRLIIMELVAQKRRRETLPFFAQYFRHHPFNGGMFILKAHALIEARDFAGAILAVEHGLSLAPDNALGFYLKSILLRRQGNRAAVLEAARKAAVLAPDNPGIQLNLVRAQAESDEAEAAAAPVQPASTLSAKRKRNAGRVLAN